MRFRFITTLILACLLSACGFKPRGELATSPFLKEVYLQTSSNFTPLSQSIERTLAEHNIALAQSADNAKIILQVFNEQESNTLMTVGASQQTRQYKLMYSLQFSLYNKQNTLILGPRTITEYRAQIIQANQLLENNSETAELYNSMRDQAVIDLMYQISSKDTGRLIARNLH